MSLLTELETMFDFGCYNDAAPTALRLVGRCCRWQCHFPLDAPRGEDRPEVNLRTVAFGLCMALLVLGFILALCLRKPMPQPAVQQ